MGMDFCPVASAEWICLTDSRARNVHFPRWALASLSTYVMGRKHKHGCPHWSCGYNLNKYWDLHFSHYWSSRGARMCPLEQQPTLAVPRLWRVGSSPGSPQGWVGCRVLQGCGLEHAPETFISLHQSGSLWTSLRLLFPWGPPQLALATLQRGRVSSGCLRSCRDACPPPCPFSRRAAAPWQTLPSLFLLCRVQAKPCALCAVGVFSPHLYLLQPRDIKKWRRRTKALSCLLRCSRGLSLELRPWEGVLIASSTSVYTILQNFGRNQEHIPGCWLLWISWDVKVKLTGWTLVTYSRQAQWLYLFRLGSQNADWLCG